MIGIGAADPKARRSPFTAGSDLEPRPEAIRGQIVDVALDEPELSRGSRVDAGNPPESAGAYADYQVPAPRQICLLPHIADMFRAALEFVGGEC
jgi:NADPH:quinone reductase-like Zn-dependent oxidoreductase